GFCAKSPRTPLLERSSPLAQLPRECPQVGDKEVGLFHRGEVTAAVELAPVHDVRQVALGEATQRKEDVGREDRDPRGYLYRRRQGTGQHGLELGRVLVVQRP